VALRCPMLCSGRSGTWGAAGGKECVRRPRPCRQRLEEARLLDARYRLQKVPGGSVALPVLEGKAAEQWLQDNVPQGLSCRLLWIQVGATLRCLPGTGSGWWPRSPRPSRRTPSLQRPPACSRLPRSCAVSCAGCWWNGEKAGRKSWSATCPAPGSGMGTWSC